MSKIVRYIPPTAESVVLVRGVPAFAHSANAQASSVIATCLLCHMVLRNMWC